MDQHRIDLLTRLLHSDSSRRTLLRGLVGAGGGLGTLRLSDAAAAKRKKKQRKRKRQQCDVCRSGCAFTSVQAAVDAANPEDIIRLCPGAYAEHISVEKNLILVGAGADRSVLDGGGTAGLVSVLGIGPAVNVQVRNLTVRGGNCGVGGGIFNEGALTLDGVLVTGNTADDGAGIFNLAGASLRLIDSRVSGNDADNGGGLWVDGGTVTLTRSRVTGNQALRGGFGGGLHVYDGAVTLNESQVTGNTASGAGSEGGGFYVFAGTVTLKGSQVTGNEAAAGGGIYRIAGSVIVEPGSVTGNTPNNCAGQTAVGNCVD